MSVQSPRLLESFPFVHFIVDFFFLLLFYFLNKSYCSNPLVATENNESLPLLHPILQIEVLIS